MDPNETTTRRTGQTRAWALAILLCFAVATWFAVKQAPGPVGTNWSGDRSVWRPFERNPFLRLPRTGPVGYLLFTPDGQRGWALVSLGTLITTGDGGATWSVLTHALPGATTLAFSGDGRRGWALGPAMLRRSTDGGRHWRTVTDPALQGKQWHALAFDSTGTHGLLAGADGVRAVTRDGGETWRVAQFAEYHSLYGAAWSLDGSSAWMVGDGGTVRVSTDGGQFWTQAAGDIPPNTTLLAVHFLRDGVHGWILSAQGALYASGDSGFHWQRMAPGAGTPLVDVRFAADARRGWALAGDGGVLATVDGGAHWKRQPMPVGGAIRRLHVTADGRTVWLAGTGGILASFDAGATWHAQTRDALARIAAMAFAADGIEGWAAGEGGMVLHTNDSGATWNGQPTGTAASLNALAVDRGGAYLWAVGDGGAFVRSTDGGKHWTGALLAEGENLRGIAFAKDRLRGVIAGERGTILATRDGGQGWTRVAGSVLPVLVDLLALNDANDLWVASVKGELARSTDGGQTWRAAGLDAFPGGLPLPAAGATALPRFSPDGRHGWYEMNRHVGCMLSLTDDSGANWRQLPIPRTAAAQCASSMSFFQDDGLRGWIVMPDEPMLTTRDGGRHLQAAWAPYQRWPGVWYWILLPFFIQGMVQVLRVSARPASHAAAASMFVDDDAIRSFAQDRLEFGPLARGLSRFLRNPKTTPPLTLAITGDWGTGKSSLMRLLCTDLQRYGQRPIWFNAWHHQKDEQMFAALLGAIQADVAPSSWKPAGWIFRLKLLWIRSKRHFALSFALLTLITSLFVFPFQHSIGELGDMVRYLSALFTGQAGTGGEIALRHVGVFAQLLALLTTARLLYKGMQSFGVDPALMFKGLSEQTSLKQATAQNTFRATFARQFEEVASALPYRMTIVVDDLDRCRPENILEVLETVNFLTASGHCFVVFGMASARVEAALGMAFEGIAVELGDAVENALDERGPVAPGDPAAAAKAWRRAYARDYLEKLINLEITVPQRRDLGADSLLAPGPVRRVTILRTAARAVAASWPLTLVAAALCAGILLGTTVRLPSLAPAAVASPPAASAPASGPAAVGAVLAGLPSSTAVHTFVRPVITVFEPGQRSPAVASYGMSLLVGAVLAAALAIHTLLRLRAQAIEVQDSLEFKQGLRVWTELAAARRRTPRAIKRWGNRMRYFAMLQQGSEIDETRGQRVGRKFAARLRQARVPRWLRRLLRPQPSASVGVPPPRTRRMVLREGRLIAIGAAHEAYGEAWLERLNGAATLPDDDLLRRVLRHYRDVTGEEWQRVSDDEAEAFACLLAGIKLPPAATPAGPPSDTVTRAQFGPRSAPG